MTLETEPPEEPRREEPPQDERHPDVRHEPEVLPHALILRIGLATLMVGASLCFVTYLLMRARIRSVRPSFDFPERTLPAPHEVATIRQELFQIANPGADLYDQQRALLDSFGWVDQRKRLVHIPIEAAIDLVVRDEAHAARRGAQ
jgi:hypothetical protein